MNLLRTKWLPSEARGRELQDNAVVCKLVVPLHHWQRWLQVHHVALRQAFSSYPRPTHWKGRGSCG